ncbi:MAG: sigma-70 family RNA polymerase sigma factor [Planctomycetes bacterium]|nr:sigma-70 family RNA polymerase sigma factor [Planctomycetota bacterium]
MSERSDGPELDAWIQRAAGGDGVALRRLLDAHLPRLRAFVRLRMEPLLRQRESGSDLVQSVCRELLEHADRFRFGGEDAFRRWLYREALRKIAHRREYWLAERRSPLREQRAPTGVDEGAGGDEAGLLACYATFCTPSHAAMAREELARVEAAFDRLSERHRDVIVRARILGQSRAEIAAEMGGNEASIGNLLLRALAALSAHLVGPADRPSST